MADEADVGNALLAIVTAAAYPNGTGQPSALGAPATIQRGWPLPADLDAALAAGKITITIFGDNGTESNTSRFSKDWSELTPASRTLTVDVEDNVLTIGGTVSTPQNVAVAIGAYLPTRTNVIYAVQPTDTLASIATGLAALLTDAGISVMTSGAVMTFLPTTVVAARVGGYGTVVRELKRQERTFTITLWCNSPAQRDVASPVIDLALVRPENLRFADGTTGRMIYQRTMVLDEKQTVQVYRRDILYRIEYATIEAAPASEILAIPTTINAHF